MINRIDHTTISVRNISKSVEFYTALLGFSVDHEMWIPESKLHIVFLRLGDTMLELFDVAEVRGTMISDVNEIVGLKHICLLVDEVNREYDRLNASGVAFRVTPVTIQDSVRIAFFKDLDGVDIELIQYLTHDDRGNKSGSL